MYFYPLPRTILTLAFISCLIRGIIMFKGPVYCYLTLTSRGASRTIATPTTNYLAASTTIVLASPTSDYLREHTNFWPTNFNRYIWTSMNRDRETVLCYIKMLMYCYFFVLQFCIQPFSTLPWKEVHCSWCYHHLLLPIMISNELLLPLIMSCSVALQNCSVLFVLTI